MRRSRAQAAPYGGRSGRAEGRACLALRRSGTTLTPLLRALRLHRYLLCFYLPLVCAFAFNIVVYALVRRHSRERVHDDVEREGAHERQVEAQQVPVESECTEERRERGTTATQSQTRTALGPPGAAAVGGRLRPAPAH